MITFSWVSWHLLFDDWGADVSMLSCTGRWSEGGCERDSEASGCPRHHLWSRHDVRDCVGTSQERRRFVRQPSRRQPITDFWGIFVRRKESKKKMERIRPRSYDLIALYKYAYYYYYSFIHSSTARTLWSAMTLKVISLRFCKNVLSA